MGVSLARKGNLELRETKETWVSQVRALWGCRCLLGEGPKGWTLTLWKRVCSVPLRTKQTKLGSGYQPPRSTQEVPSLQVSRGQEREN